MAGLARGGPLFAVAYLIRKGVIQIVNVLNPPLEATLDITKDLGITVIKESSEVVKKTSGYLKLITDYIYYYITHLSELIGLLPKIIFFVLKNLTIFLYVFCLLIVLGRFDWLLSDVYTTAILSAVIVYLTYR